MEKSKKEFEENLQNFNNVRLKNIYKHSSYYISFDEKSKTIFLWIKKKYSEYNHEKTIKNYKNAIYSFFENGEKSVINRINENNNNIINNIEGIYYKFNEEVGGFKDNFDEFKKIVEDIENFIYMKTGIIG